MRLYHLAMVAIALIGGVTSLLWIAGSTTRPSPPGRLVPLQADLSWRSSPPGESNDLETAFVLRNVGGEPVEVVSVTTGCGCVEARVEPKIVAPGQETEVLLRVDPVEVGTRPVPIYLVTDSPLTPDVQLELMVKGYRSPPYLFEIRGELYYPAGSTLEERRLRVSTVEPRVDQGVRPIVSLSEDLDFLRVGDPVVVDEFDDERPDFVVRTYEYPSSLCRDCRQSGSWAC